MLTVSKLRRKPRHFTRLTGLSVEQFEHLVRDLTPVYAQHQAKQRQHQHADRQRLAGGGHPFALELSERLLSTLLYFRLYVTGTLLSYLFNLDESNLCRERNHRMLPALQAVLPTPMQDHLLSALEDQNQKPKRRKRLGTLQELLEAHPELEDIWADATEQEVPKPQDKGRKKQLYSGKSHCHTLKTQLVTSGRLILHAFGGIAGSIHDRQLLRASGIMRSLPALASASASTSSKRKVRLDRGYDGAKKEWQQVPWIEVVIGVKGRRNRLITALGRALNRVLSKKRMQIEQNIGHLKNWRLLSGLYRGQHQRYFDLTCVVAGLHNFKLLPGGVW